MGVPNSQVSLYQYYATPKSLLEVLGLKRVKYRFGAERSKTCSAPVKEITEPKGTHLGCLMHSGAILPGYSQKSFRLPISFYDDQIPRSYVEE